MAESVDPKEVEKFAAMAPKFWDEEGPYKPLHKLNPVRIAFIRDHILEHFGVPLADLSILDVGCGGGILSVPLSKIGASVVGIDVTAENIQVAEAYCQQHQVSGVEFRHIALEDMPQEEKFDVVLVMEVLEHVNDVETFLSACINRIKPGGMLFISTINRTAKSYLLAIMGAEYIARWVPIGTHDWAKFLPPDVINEILEKNGMTLTEIKGTVYRFMAEEWELSKDTSVNYMLCATA